MKYTDSDPLILEVAGRTGISVDLLTAYLNRQPDSAYARKELKRNI